MVIVIVRLLVSLEAEPSYCLQDLVGLPWGKTKIWFHDQYKIVSLN